MSVLHWFKYALLRLIKNSLMSLEYNINLYCNKKSMVYGKAGSELNRFIRNINLKKNKNLKL